MNISYKDERYIQRRLSQMYGKIIRGVNASPDYSYTYLESDGSYALGYDIPWLCKFYGVHHSKLLMNLQYRREQQNKEKYIKENKWI